ncbi:hypothetical protein PSGE105469_24375 [Pseudomonas gessardii]
MAGQQRPVYPDRQHDRAETHGGTHARRHARAVPWHAGHDVFLGIAIEQAGTGTGHGYRQGERQVTAGSHCPGAEQVAAAHQGQAGRHHGCRSEAAGQACADTRADQHGQGKRQHPQARGNRGKPQAVLQVERQQRHHHLGTTGIGKHPQQGPDKPRVLEQLQVHHGPALQTLHQHKQAQQERAAEQPRIGQRVVPADPVGFDQAPDQAQQAGAEGQAAPGIEACRLAVARFRDGVQDQRQQGQAHRQVEVENPAPAHVVGNQAAKGRGSGHRHAHAGAPERPGLGPFQFIMKGMADGG